jgi:hypothetical protein
MATGQKPSQLSHPQWDFLKGIRAQIKNDAGLFFKQNNWRMIMPPGGRYDNYLLNSTSSATTTVEAFYVKPVACWAPHLLIANHVPCCPHCKKRDEVDIVSARWINSPKVLFGVERTSYLDTFLYPCGRCKKTFAGYNKSSMQLDASVYYGYFNFYLGHGYAVDEQLYALVVEYATTTSTSVIAKRLLKQAYNGYYNDYQLYLSAVGMNKIRPKKKQKTMKSHFNAVQDKQLDRLQRLKSDAASRVARSRLSLSSARVRRDTDVRFHSILSDKGNHNIHGTRNILPGLGSTKLQSLIDIGITSMFELLAAEEDEYAHYKYVHLLGHWQELVLLYLNKFDDEIQAALEDLDYAEVDLDVAQSELNDYLSRKRVADEARARSEAINPYLRRGNSPTEVIAIDVSNDPPPLFSKFNDKTAYNGRVLSKHRIDSIVTTVFNHRKTFQESKMMGLTAEILKIDFNYKIASKIRVWSKAGNSFAPYKCIVTIHNEDGLTVYWKVLKHSESFTEIVPDLKRLRNRLNKNLRHKMLETAQREAKERGEPLPTELPNDSEIEAVKVIYVDNCCNVRRILARCFPGAADNIKLDLFHWLKRWNDIMDSPSSAQAGIFRGLMSRALFNVEPLEYERVMVHLRQKMKQEPTVKEILRHANSVVPDPVTLRKNVEATFLYAQARDAEVVASLSIGRSEENCPTPKRFFISSASKVQQKVQDQLRHVDCNCLSDPTCVNIFRYNRQRDVTYVARGTNTNERDNLDLAENILSATHIGKFQYSNNCTFALHLLIAC